jgi:hypothetical protein
VLLLAGAAQLGPANGTSEPASQMLIESMLPNWPISGPGSIRRTSMSVSEISVALRPSVTAVCVGTGSGVPMSGSSRSTAGML